jgi:hypothetical protein
MNSELIAHIKRTYSHAKLGNGNKIVVARLSADLKEDFSNRLTVAVNGEVRNNYRCQTVTVDKYYIMVYVGETTSQRFNMVLDTLLNVKEVRKIELTEKMVKEIRITADAANVEVITDKDIVRVYKLFN